MCEQCGNLLGIPAGKGGAVDALIAAGLASLPEYPEAVALESEHQPFLTAVCAKVQPRISELSFSYLWLWRRYIRCRLSRHGGALLIVMSSPKTGRTTLFPPLLVDEQAAAQTMQSVLDAHAAEGTLSFARVPAGPATACEGRAGLAIKEERGRADYVYRAESMLNLAGKRFRQKRQHIAKFRAACPDAVYRELDSGLARECAAFSRGWLETHPNKQLEGLQREVETTVLLLENWDRLPFTGGALLEGERILAFAVGERLNADTLAVRVEKADNALAGSYQVIAQEFVRHAGAGYTWINREQDLGVPGLRRAKKSWYPDHLLRKYRVSRRDR